MKTFGFYGGFGITEVGSRSDVENFFSCVEKVVVEYSQCSNWSLISDRLYKRYIFKEDLKDSLITMKKIERAFEDLPLSVLPRTNTAAKQKETWLNMSAKNLKELFGRFFISFEDTLESAEYYLNAFDDYRAVRILPSDIPAMVIEETRPLSEYDALGPTDPPFWLR